MNADARQPLRQALAHLEQGDWQAAHGIVQGLDTAEACWVHAIVHVMEGDMDNARYWYGRAHRAFSPDAAAQIAAVRLALQ